MGNFDYEHDHRGERGSDGGGQSDEVHSVQVKAGKRTYYFDVKATRAGDYYLTITENRKVSHPDGTFTFDKHKIFLYKEDFRKFADGLTEALDFVRREKPEFFEGE